MFGHHWFGPNYFATHWFGGMGYTISVVFRRSFPINRIGSRSGQ